MVAPNVVQHAYPHNIKLGTSDQSMKFVPPADIPIPTHLPFVPIWAAKGPRGRQLVDGSTLLAMYGSDSFTIKKKYYTHATKLLEVVLGNGNNVVVERLIPDDVDTLANLTIYLDVANVDVPLYKRNSDGSIAYDSNGDPIVEKDEDGNDITIDGYKIRVIGTVDKLGENDLLGYRTVKEGTMENKDGSKSFMYPIIEIAAKYLGEWYNRVGLSIGIPNPDELQDGLVENIKTFPYQVSLFVKDDSGVPVIFKDLSGSNKNILTLKNKVSNPITNMSMDLPSINNYWYNTEDDTMPLVHPDIQTVHVYENNLNNILDKLYETEKEYMFKDITTTDGTVVNTRDWFDFIEHTNDEKEDNKWIINVLSGVSLKRKPYFSIVIDKDVDSSSLPENSTNILIGNNNPFFLGNGTDGTMNYDNFETLIGRIMDKYIDPNSEVHDTAINVDSIFYDTGYTLELKMKLINYITLRKDTFLVLSTREMKSGRKYNDLTTERGIAIALRSRLDLSPESTYFGTPVARAMIVGGAGLLKNWITEDTSSRLEYDLGSYWPLTLHVADKASAMMGAGNGYWKRGFLFDQGDRNIIDKFYDIKPAFIPEGIKPSIWNLGLVWADNYDLKRKHFQAMQTVYKYSNSVLNSFFTAMAISFLEKLGDKAHRKFTGNVSYSKAEFIDKVTKYLVQEVQDRFAGIINVLVNVYITEFDDLRGYSWTVEFKLGANVQKTVSTTYILAYRSEDLA